MNPQRWMWPAAFCLIPLASCGRGTEVPNASPPVEATIAIERVNVIPMTPGTRVLADQTVIVTGDRITAIGPSGQVRVPPRARRVDAAGHYLIPGLADMHVHLEHFEDPHLLTLFLAAGVTTVRNMDGRPQILEWRRRVAEGDLPGPSIRTAGPILDGDPPLLPDNTRIRDAGEARSAVRSQAAAGYDFVKVYTNLSAPAYAAVLLAASELGMPVVGHVPREVSVEEALRGGLRSIEHLADFGSLIETENSPVRGRFHWSRLYLAMPADPGRTREAARLIAASNVWIVPTLVQSSGALAPLDSTARWLSGPGMEHMPDAAREYWSDQARTNVGRMDDDDWAIVVRGRENRIRMLQALHASGARLLIGTDTPNPFVVPGYSVHEEMNSFVEAGLPPEQVLTMATREAARFLGELEEWGTISVGKRADLVLLARDPLRDIRNVRRPVAVMAGGRWYPVERLEQMLRSMQEIP